MNAQTLPSEELVRRYVSEVARRLPKDSREDVAKELASLLRETIEERSVVDLAETNPKITAEVLVAFGSPEVAAARYSPKPNYLIGPNLYPNFMFTLKIVFMASLGLATLTVVTMSFAGSVTGPLHGALRFLQLLLQCLYSFGAIAVLVFVLLERYGTGRVSSSATSPWDPFSLPSLGESDQISSIGVTLKIYVLTILLIWFNFFPQWFGMSVGINTEGARFISAADLGLTLPVLLINCWWIAALIKNFLLLRQGSMTSMIRWFDVALGASAALIVGLILNDLLAVIDTTPFREAFGNAELADLMSRLFLAIATGIVVLLLGRTALKLYRSLRPRQSAIL